MAFSYSYQIIFPNLFDGNLTGILTAGQVNMGVMALKGVLYIFQNWSIATS